MIILYAMVAYAIGWIAGHGPLRLVGEVLGAMRSSCQLPATAREIRRERKAGRLVLK